MRYGISAGSILVNDGKVLLVHHRGDGLDFWVPPDGSVEGEESVFECARREAFEETGLQVELKRIVYIEEFVDGDLRFTKFYILVKAFAGELTTENLEPEEDFLVDARFFSKLELEGITVYPPVLRDEFWRDMELGFPETKYLGLHKIQ